MMINLEKKEMISHRFLGYPMFQQIHITIHTEMSEDQRNAESSSLQDAINEEEIDVWTPVQNHPRTGRVLMKLASPRKISYQIGFFCFRN